MWSHYMHLELLAYKLYLPSIGSARRVQHGYGDNDYRLKLNHRHTHELRACEISPIHYVVLSNEVLCVITLALGSQPRQGFTKVRAKSEAQESHFMFPGV
jgi:hypothetical protein